MELLVFILRLASELILGMLPSICSRCGAGCLVACKVWSRLPGCMWGVNAKVFEVKVPGSR